MSQSEQKESPDEQSFSYGDDIKVSRNAHDALPVPLNGVNIPSTMPDDNWQSRPIIDSTPVDTSIFGTEYKLIELQRIELTQIKKDLATLHKYVVQYQSDKSDANKQQRDDMIYKLNNSTQQFNTASWYEPYHNVIDIASQDEISSDRMIVFAHDDIKRLSALVFNYNQKLMQQLKSIKQQYNKSHNI